MDGKIIILRFSNYLFGCFDLRLLRCVNFFVDLDFIINILTFGSSFSFFANKYPIKHSKDVTLNTYVTEPTGSMHVIVYQHVPDHPILCQINLFCIRSYPTGAVNGSAYPLVHIHNCTNPDWNGSVICYQL